jgi:ATP-dependent RNA helicase RhlE
MFFSATMPAEIRKLTGEMLQNPVTIQRERPSTTPTGITQAVYPVSQDLKPALLVALLKRGDIKQALVFTRTKHRANRLADALQNAGIRCGKIHGNRSQGQRTLALDEFKSGKCPVLVATDIVARGIDVEDLGHVVNFDVPVVADDYIHRIGRTGRAEATGEAFTLAAPDERASLQAIERALGRPLQRVTVPDFDYNARPAERLEIPLAQRIAEIRRRKADDRARSEAKRAEDSTSGNIAAEIRDPTGRIWFDSLSQLAAIVTESIVIGLLRSASGAKVASKREMLTRSISNSLTWSRTTLKISSTLSVSTKARLI